MIGRQASNACALLVAIAATAPARADPLSLEGFFVGRLAATGQVENLREGGTRPFTMDMTAHWEGPVGTLVEEVAFADGERQHKVWTFRRPARADSSESARISRAMPR